MDDRPPLTFAFFPEGAFGPTNNCVGIGDVLRRRGHRVVFIVEESFAGTLGAKGFEERLMRLGPPPERDEEPGQFWKEFIREAGSRTGLRRPARHSARQSAPPPPFQPPARGTTQAALPPRPRSPASGASTGPT
jgi:hypothetical protein